KREEAQKLVDGWKARVAAVQQKIGKHQPPKVFVYDSGEDKPFTSGKYAMPTAIIEAAGGKNIMDNLDASWATTSWESVATQEPDVIVLLDYQTGGGAAALQHFLESHPLMKETPAVKNHHYVKLQYSELTPGPANIDAVEKLAKVLYPDATH
ncbi:ABC transporter substrate-binding protein, partial [Ewingella americana]